MPAAAPEKEVAVAADQAGEGAYIYVLILLYRCVYMCPHTARNVYMCPHTIIYRCIYMCPHTGIDVPFSIPAAAPEKEVAVAADQVGEGTEVHADTLEEQLIKTNLW